MLPEASKDANALDLEEVMGVRVITTYQLARTAAAECRYASTLLVLLTTLAACERRTLEVAPSPGATPVGSATPSVRASTRPPAPEPAPPAASTRVCPHFDATTKLAWTDETSYRLVVDEDACSCLSDAERASVAFVSAAMGSDCEWVEGTDLADPRHMDCTLTTALGLGHQCEDKHKGLVEAFLGNDAPAQCAKVPTTAYAQTALLTLSLRHEKDLITVSYEAVTTTGPTGEAWRWSEVIDFRNADPRVLTIAKRRKARKKKQAGG